MATFKQLLHRLKDNITYTPSSDEVAEAVEAFTTSDKGQGWIDNAIAHDAALKSKISNGDDTEARAEALTYQGLHAISLHEKAHALYERGDFLEARRLSQGARRVTAGIEIHPGANIGKNCFIDHGASLVIGETTIIGDNVFLYHGVTLGATDGTKDTGGRRHPKIGNNVEVGNGAQVLGKVDVRAGVKIAAGAKIIGNHIVIEEGARIGPDVKIVEPKGKYTDESPLIIGRNATIEAGVEVRKSILTDAHVWGAVPNIPGVIPGNQALSPIYTLKPSSGIEQPLNKVDLQGLEWYSTLVAGLKQMIGFQPSAT